LIVSLEEHNVIFERTSGSTCTCDFKLFKIYYDIYNMSIM